MYAANDLPDIVCPNCNAINESLEVIRMYVFTQSTFGKEPYYYIKCNNCNENFTSQVYVSDDDI